RFDFSHFEKVSDEQLAKIEEIVNKRIQAGFDLQEFRAIPITEAEEKGAMMLFGEKYGDTVRMIQFGDSKELCGGIHVKNTKEIGLFKIKSEGSVAAGIRRVEALTNKGAAEWLKRIIEVYDRNKIIFKTTLTEEQQKQVVTYREKYVKQYQLISGMPELEEFDENFAVKEIDETINQLKKIKETKSIVDNLIRAKKQHAKDNQVGNQEQAKAIKADLLTKVEVVNGINVIAQRINLDDSAAIKDLAFQLKGQIDNLFLVLGAEVNNKPNLTIVVSDNLLKDKNLHAGNIVKEAAKEMQGGGGGQPFYATAGGNNLQGLDAAITKALSFLN
ncbi:MAG: hypothetical protein KDD24_07385, partial [Flavobacteriales bacterium]|nr:hypothetical protein [Flavobacteriales bacterium]